jgi:hypothetical protein
VWVKDHYGLIVTGNEWVIDEEGGELNRIRRLRSGYVYSLESALLSNGVVPVSLCKSGSSVESTRYKSGRT